MILFGEIALRSHSDVITTLLRPSRSHRDPTTLPLRLYHAVHDHSTILARPCRPHHALLTTLLRSHYDHHFYCHFHIKYIKKLPRFCLSECIYPFALTAQLCFSFLYRLDRWFSRLNGLTLVFVWALYSVLFGVSQGSVLKAVPCT